MIDEDLYQQATDELNSDKRRLHIWARACALASDDHDEARYLYTNLRVEELIAERENHGLPPVVDGSSDADYQYDATLVLEPLQPVGVRENEDEDNPVPESMSAHSGIDLNRAQEEILTLNSEMEKNNELIDSLERKSFEEKFNVSEDTLSHTGEQHDDAFSEDFLDETINLTSELDGTAVFELGTSDATEYNSDDFGENARRKPSASTVVSDDKEDDELEALLGGVYQASKPTPPTDPFADDETGTDFSEVSDSHAEFDERLDERLDEHLDEPHDEHLEWTEDEEPDEHPQWTDGEQLREADNRELQSYSPRTRGDQPLNETDRLARELERQANDLPGQRNDIVAVTHSVDDKESSASTEDQHEFAANDTFDEEAERDIAQSLQQKRVSGSHASHDDAARDSQPPLELADDADNQEHAATHETADTLARHDTVRHVPELPIDLSEQQSGRRYTVFRRGDQVQAVKNGVSWSALFLTLPYLIYRHLFGTALVYGALWLIVLAGLLVAGLAWLDAGTAAGSFVKYTTAGFALLALIGLFYLPFRHGNQWREDKLEQRGFELVAWVRASSPGKAISAARRAAALD